MAQSVLRGVISRYHGKMPPSWNADLRPALTAATAYFLALFALGFILGTIRVVFAAPRFGQLIATIAEVPVMVASAAIICRWALGQWRVPAQPAIRWAMAAYFLVLLAIFESILGLMLFGRTPSEQWAAFGTPAGLIGLSAQIIAALLPVFLNQSE